MILKEAVDKLRTSLKEDSELYDSYHASLSMAYQDEYFGPPHGKVTIANKAATRFLSWFLMDCEE